jgi:catechol 2,3-dioxygenase-like lactoylglutathione lyase family enzyme
MKKKPIIVLATVLTILAACWCVRQSRADDKKSGQGEPDRSLPTTGENQMERVTGIGGVFFKAREPKKMAAWYRDHLGIQSQGGYADFVWREKDNPERTGHTAWALFPTNTSYFGSSAAPMMINYRVANLERMLAQLRRAGVAVEKVQEQDYGRFAWITDPEGNRIELWEPKGK